MQETPEKPKAPESGAKQSFRIASFISLIVNGVMVCAGAIATLVPGLRWFSTISAAIAKPPSLILRWVIKPDVHSVLAYVLAATAGMLGSWLFYTLAAWGVLWALARWRGDKGRRASA